MKTILTPLLLFLFLELYASGQGLLDKPVTLKYRDEKVEVILKEITSQTGVNFSYSKSKVPVNKRVSIDVKNASLEEALKELLQTLPIQYEVVSNQIILKYKDLRQTIRGRVIDKGSNQPIFGATIQVLGSDPLIGTITDSEGYFRMDEVPVGRWNIRVDYVGYQSREFFDVLVGVGREVVLTATLVEAVTEMKEVVIRGLNTKFEPINDMATVSARSFTMEETQRYAASVGDPGRLATAFPGVSGGDDTTNELIIRGNSSRGLLWRLEGVEIPSPNHFSAEGSSAGGISMINTNVMAASDFLTGAFPAQYGNALSGVFDMNLRTGNNEKREYILQAGFLGLDIAAEGPFVKGKNASYLVNYRYSTLDILSKLGFNVQDEDERNIFQDLALKLNFPTKKAGTFSLWGLGGLSSFREEIPGEINDREDFNMGVIGLSHEISINSTTWLTTTASLSATKTIDDLQLIRETPDITRDREEFVRSFGRFNMSLNKKFNAQHQLEVGGVFSLMRFNYSGTFVNTLNDFPFNEFERFNDKGNTNSIQGFATWKFQASNKLSFVGGAHVLHFAFNNQTSVEPRAGLKWQFHPKLSLSGAYGRHSRIESLQYYLGNWINDDGTTTQHNNNLGLTRANHYVVGFDWQINEKWYFKTEAYYQDLFDVPVSRTFENIFSSILLEDGYTVDPLDNSGTARNYGVEFSIERAFRNNYYFMANFALYEAKYTPSTGVEINSRYNGNFVTHVLGGKEFMVGKDKTNIFGINLRGTFSGNQRYIPIDVEETIAQETIVLDYDRAFEDRLPNYFRIDFQLLYRKNKRKHTSEWRLDIQNITDNENVLGFQYTGPYTREIDTQLPLVPVLSYRIEF